MTSVRQYDVIYLGLDVHKNSISVGVLGFDEDSPRNRLDLVRSRRGATACGSFRRSVPAAGLLRGRPDRL
jgi:hypothetical protein